MATRKKNTFTWKGLDAEGEQVEISAPKFSSVIDTGFARRHRNDDIMEQIWAAAEEGLDEENLAKFDGLSQEASDEFYSAWQEDSGITAGESSAS